MRKDTNNNASPSFRFFFMMGRAFRYSCFAAGTMSIFILLHRWRNNWSYQTCADFGNGGEFVLLLGLMGWFYGLKEGIGQSAKGMDMPENRVPAAEAFAAGASS